MTLWPEIMRVVGEGPVMSSITQALIGVALMAILLFQPSGLVSVFRRTKDR